MLTEQEISQFETFDVVALEEGIRQVELSLSHSLETKNSLEQKTFSLLTIFVSFATLALGIPSSHLISGLSPALVKVIISITDIR